MDVSSMQAFERYLTEAVLPASQRQPKLLESFWEVMKYSLFSGGKRFRPQLSFATAEALDVPVESVFGLAASVEMIHTYSLIHDDLPCLDNDDFRRGNLSSHKKFGEPLALLAGDALLTEAFFHLSSTYKDHAAVGELIALISEAAGPRGMVGGQVLDIREGKKHSELVLDIHRMKTAELIRASIQGVAVLQRANEAAQQAWGELGTQVGLAFQLKDDLLDADEEESTSYVTTSNLEETKALLDRVTDRATEVLNSLKVSATSLKTLIEFNQHRSK